MGTVRTFKDLIVWQKAHALVLDIYRITRNFPKEERFGIVSQLRSSSSSIPSNIVEGNKRRSRREYLRFLNTAESSLEETKYHALLSRDLEYLNEEEYERISSQCDEVGKMLFRLQESLIAKDAVS